MSAIDRLIQGAVDIHVHFGPDPRVERRAGALETARRAAELGMRALVLKSHEYPTMPVAATVQPLVPEVQLIGGVSLDEEVGGLNPHAVEASARMGAKVVWMPTFSAAADHARRGVEGGIPVMEEGGRLRPEVYPVLEVVKRYDMVLCTGHLAPQESLAVVAEARGMGIHRLVVTHASLIHRWMGMTVEQMRELARLGAFIEHSINVIMPLREAMPPRELAAMVRAVGAESCILSTDFGQAFHPIPPEGMRMAIGTMLHAGLDEMEVGLMVKDNPARLLGL